MFYNKIDGFRYMVSSIEGVRSVLDFVEASQWMSRPMDVFRSSVEDVSRTFLEFFISNRLVLGVVSLPPSTATFLSIGIAGFWNLVGIKYNLALYIVAGLTNKKNKVNLQ